MKKKILVLSDLKAGNVILVKTKNHKYELRVINPKTSEVEVTSKKNPHVQGTVKMRVLFSIATREIKKTKKRVILSGIAKGYYLALDGILISRVKKISLKI